MACASVQSSCCSCLHFVAGCVTASQVGAVEPADLQWRFPKTFLQFIVAPHSNWVKRLDPDHTKTAEEQDALLHEDS